MSTQTEALRLADELEMWTLGEPAAAELRPLHQFAEDQIGRATAAEAALQMTKATHALKIAEAALQMTKATHALKIAAVEAQRDALLEACRAMLTFIERHAPRGLQPEPGSPVAMARAAIKQAEENT